MSSIRHHIEWLSLVPTSGPFLSLPVLISVFPQGLDAHDADHARRLRLAFDEWDDDQSSSRPDPRIHQTWIKWVLAETLGYDELLAEKQAIPQTLKSELAEYGVTLRPDWIVNDPATKKARLLVQVYPRSQSLTKPVQSSRWNASPDTRMMQLLHDTGIRLGIVTNGDHWMLVNAPKNETTGYASWYANLWLEEQITLRAFRTLLCADRFFSVPENETLEALLDKSADDQQEVTDQLGYQVRKAVEVAIQALNKADQDHGGKLLADVSEKVLYESALTVMMRLVFLFCAEERELLLLGDDLYDKNYAVSTLREQLRVTADQQGEEILALRHDAWTRLLTTFRAVYAGIRHHRLKLPAYGGSLFNPDRFPFLEGRTTTNHTNHTNQDTEAGAESPVLSASSSDSCDSCYSWLNSSANPFPVSNRTVLHLLEALQVLQVRLSGGGTAEARKLSFRSLDIEQIGHVYEGLLDHTAKRATEPMLGLQGTRDKEPEIALTELENLASKGENELLKFLKDVTGRSTVNPIKKALKAELDDQLVSRFRTACQDSDLWKRVKPFAGLVRLDTVGYPVVILTGSVFVTAGTDRRSSGTHYTPKSLTEPIVQYTLEPLVYIGPAEGLPKDQWKLRSAKELLDLKICDMACGSGAFLVQACRYMAARLLEVWQETTNNTNNTNENKDRPTVINPKSGELAFPSASDSLDSCYSWLTLPADLGERLIVAMRIVAQRCLYGVDKNPLAAEMAKLSLWLLTLAKDRPFEFLDHAIRCGDSLVGIHNLDQLNHFNMEGKPGQTRIITEPVQTSIKEAVSLRRQIAEMQANTVEDVEAQDRMLREANEKIDRLKCAADMLISAEFVPGSAADKRAARDIAGIKVAVHFNDSDLSAFRREAQKALGGQMTFHWPLEFPEVMSERGGFDAFVGNPPFMGGVKITPSFGFNYTCYLKSWNPSSQQNTDLIAYFLVRAFRLLNTRGCFGLLGTNSIGQTDTRLGGLGVVCQEGGTISRAYPHIKWPGRASLYVSAVWVSASWRGPAFLEENQVERIDSSLELQTIAQQPFYLTEMNNLGFVGAKPYGEGFFLKADEAAQLSNGFPGIVKRYLNGRELMSNPGAEPTRWVIDFGSLSASEASRYEECFALLKQRVFGERQTSNIKSHREKWWLFGYRPNAFFKFRIDHYWACSQTAKYLAWERFPVSVLFDQKLIAVALPTFSAFSVLQSSFHEKWAVRYGSTLKLDPVYAPTECLATFPFPFSVDAFREELPAFSDSGRHFYEARRTLMKIHSQGLTEVLNRYHNPNETSADIQKLRQLHVEMDNAVAAAYGWADLDLGHGFHETKQGVRYTISEAARREVLARLLRLNHERYAEEVKQGLHEKKKPRNTRKTRKKTDEGGGLFQEDEA